MYLRIGTLNFDGVCSQGVPAEVYSHGFYQMLPNLLSEAGSLLAVWTFVPLYYNLQVVSVFQVHVHVPNNF